VAQQLTRRFHLPSAVRPSEARIDPEAARELVGAGATLIDVRRHDDHGTALEGAERLTPDVIPGHLPRFPRDVPIVLACT
jgi:hypothetical protein